MKTVTIIFRNSHGNPSGPTDYNNVVDVVYHTYGFVELNYGDTLNEQFNLSEIFSIKVTTPPAPTK